MGKKKNRNKKRLSDNVRSSKSTSEIKTNPFEIRINKQKHQILNKKISKHDRGLPGVSRGKAIKKRKETLLKEYQQRNKTNQYLDKRLGENDPDMSVEDKMMQRFALERQKAHEKSVLYNLNDDEEQLTHYGQSLTDIEKQETILESEDEEDGDADEDRFGGLLTRKKASSEKQQDGQMKSRKEVLDEIIVKSKKEKYERQNEKDTLIGLTEELDKEWKDVSLLLAKGNKSTKDDRSRTGKSDAYDIAVRELMYDMKAAATDRLKSPEEIAKEEKERLDAMEEDRQRRMRGEVTDDGENNTKKSKHISADDLCDDFEYSTVDKTTLSYNDGKANINPDDMADSAETESQGKDEEDDDDEEDSDGDGEDDDEDDEEEEEDNHSDLESDGDTDGDDDGEQDDEDEEDDDDEEEEVTFPQTPTQGKKDVKIIQQAAEEELPYTFKAPDNYKEFQQLVGGQSSANQLIIIERIRKCHHPSLAEGNKEKLETLFSVLLEYFGVVAAQYPLDMEHLNKLTRHLHGLSQQSPTNTGLCFQSLIVERYQKFLRVAEKRGGKPDFPPIDTLIYLKLVSVLYPTSDFRHGVTTPSMLFLGQILAQCPVRSCKDVAFGLFICNLFTQYITSAKRFVPELINFLHGLLFLASDKPHMGHGSKSQQSVQSLSDYHLVPPFKPVGKYIDVLRLSSEDHKKTRQMTTTQLNIAEVLSLPAKEISHELDTDEFRIWALGLALHLLCELSNLYEHFASFSEIFHPVEVCLKSGRLPLHRYPEQIKTLCNNLQEKLIVKDGTHREWLQRERKRPQSIRMLDPLIEEDYNPTRKKKAGTKELNERQKLVSKHRREMKGAIREVRKDAQFLARHKLNEQLTKDAERRQRVKEIHHILGTQEGEFKAMQRKKAKL